MVPIQTGYCVSDIISECGVGSMIYQITLAKSAKEDHQSTDAGHCLCAHDQQSQPDSPLFRFSVSSFGDDYDVHDVDDL